MKDRIKNIRKELDLTQQKFANKLGVQRNTIAMYEMGKILPSEAVMLSICREFNISEEWLRYGTGEMHIKISRDEQITGFVNTVLSTEKETFKKRFVRVLSQLNEDEWELLEEKARELIGYEAQMQQEEEKHQPKQGTTPQESDIEERVNAYREYLETKEKATGKLSS